MIRSCALFTFCLTFAAMCAFADDAVIAIDVGHSAQRPGAISARGATEYSFNTALARVLLHTLQERGFPGAFLLDSGDARRSPAQRARLAQKRNAAILLSIHHDSVQPHYLKPWVFQGSPLKMCNVFQGYSLFYSEKNPLPEQSLALAQALGTALRAAGFTPSAHHAEPIPGENRPFVDPVRGIYRFDDLIVLKTADAPAVLFEAGIIVNSIEERALRNPVRRQRMALALAHGILRFLGHSPPAVNPPFAPPSLRP